MIGNQSGNLSIHSLLPLRILNSLMIESWFKYRGNKRTKIGIGGRDVKNQDSQKEGI